MAYEKQIDGHGGTGSSVNISEFRKSPTRYFLEHPVEVQSRGQPIGYLISAEYFEMMLRALAQHEDPAILKKELGLTDDWLRKTVHENR